ncbi:MAG: hypothetical protein V4607_01980 [Pseudomonadota bacterium]
MALSRRVIEALAVTAEICGGEISDAAAKVMLMDLSAYPEQAVLAALQRLRREHSGRLVLAAIIARIDDGRPGVEVAWAMVPRTEYDTAVLTQEALIALSQAQPLLNRGDEIGARMAFKEAYNSAMVKARAEQKPVQWQVSLGFDAPGRPGPLAEAVRYGRISIAEAENSVHGEHLREMLSLAGVTNHPALAAPERTNAQILKFVPRKAIEAETPRQETA